MAAVVAAPAAKGAIDLTGRFWKGVLDSLGKDAYVSHRQRIGKKVSAKNRVLVTHRHVLGWERTVDRSGEREVITEGFRVARWEALPILVVGGGLAAASFEKTTGKKLVSYTGAGFTTPNWHGIPTGLPKFHGPSLSILGKKV